MIDLNENRDRKTKTKKKRNFFPLIFFSTAICRKFYRHWRGKKNFFVSLLLFIYDLFIFTFDQMKEFKDWQKAWRETNLERIEMEKKLREEKKSPEIEKKIKIETTDAEVRATTPTKPVRRARSI